jgi:SAM-dependent methyltransferase
VQEDPKKIVRDGYDSCGLRYNAARAHDPSPELGALLEVLPSNASVLDIGCGGGQPVAATLLRQAAVTGVDISPVQIEEARRRLPSAQLIVGDDTTMYWSHFETEWYVSALEELGFHILKSGVLGHGYRQVPGLPSERHPVLFARASRFGSSAS